MVRGWAFTRRLIVLAVCILILAGSSGCGTKVKSVRLGRSAQPNQDHGIPYQLTKPRFTVAISPATADAGPKYTLQVEHVPDPEHRYALRVDPGPFSEADVEVSLRPDGTISSLTTASREQVTPAIKAIGEFAGSILGAATSLVGVGLMATDDERQALDRIRVEVSTRLEERRASWERERDALPQLADPTPEQRAARERLEAMIAAAQALAGRINDAKNKNGSDASLFARALRPQSSAERNVLQVVADPETGGDRPQRAREAFDAAKNLDNPTLPLGTLVPERITREWDLVVGEVEYAVAREDLIALLKFMRRNEVPQEGVPNDWLGHLKDRAKDLSALAITHVLASTKFADLIVSPAKERYDRLAELQKELADCQTALLTASDTERSRLEVVAEGIQERIHHLIGAGQEYAAIKKLEDRLKNGPPAANDVGHGTPLEEYAAVRTQLAAFREDVTRKLARVAADTASGTAGAPAAAKKVEWEPRTDEVAFLWNVPREVMEGGVTYGSKRLLRSGTGDLSVAEQVADRVTHERAAKRNEDKKWADRRAWPKYVVRITGVQP